MTTTQEIERKVYAKAVVDADRELSRAQDVLTRIKELSDDPSLLAGYTQAVTSRQMILNSALALLRTTGALDGYETEDGAVVRAFQWADVVYMQRPSANPPFTKGCLMCGTPAPPPLIQGLCRNCRAVYYADEVAEDEARELDEAWQRDEMYAADPDLLVEEDLDVSGDRDG